MSPDLFLENIHLVGLFLNGGSVTHIPDYDSKGRWHESGDLVEIDTEPVIILGWGECREDAVSNAKDYYRRLIKWHNGDSNPNEELKVEFYGHDLAQSELLNTSFSSESDSYSDYQPAAKKRRQI
ncbi:uncharacterized protein LOC117642866 [Thrips palmi]|uniref:Uncharacterized protein LOC117642866 n=1 Tax=Thrips palmi TaxID=161013 RepID=A0A6P8YTG4_THRPL|nr:uncharacterized protein LOC117642866 [Thrips palmi]